MTDRGAIYIRKRGFGKVQAPYIRIDHFLNRLRGWEGEKEDAHAGIGIHRWKSTLG